MSTCPFGRCKRDAITAQYEAAKRELDRVREENVRVRDKLLSITKECGGCNGTGLITTLFEARNGDAVTTEVECEDCADIREALA